MISEEQIKNLVDLIKAARLLGGQDAGDEAMSERDRRAVADLVLSGWKPVIAAEFVRLNYPLVPGD